MRKMWKKSPRRTQKKIRRSNHLRKETMLSSLHIGKIISLNNQYSSLKLPNIKSSRLIMDWRLRNTRLSTCMMKLRTRWIKKRLKNLRRLTNSWWHSSRRNKRTRNCCYPSLKFPIRRIRPRKRHKKVECNSYLLRSQICRSKIRHQILALEIQNY